MKPPFTYYGGKVRMAPLIVSLLPHHETYIEPFFGSGAVLFAKRPSTHEIVNDINGAIVNFFRVLREQPAEIERACALTPYARDKYEASGDLEASDAGAVERARRFWVRVCQSHQKTAGPRTGWSVTTSRTQSPPASVIARIGRFADVAARLAQVSIEHCDAADLVSRLATRTTVVYADPPYLAKTRRSGRGQGFQVGDYGNDMPDEERHAKLADALKATHATVLLSGYPSALYEKLYRGWSRIDVAITCNSGAASRGSARSKRTECIWSNRPLARGLFDGAA